MDCYLLYVSGPLWFICVSALGSRSWRLGGSSVGKSVLTGMPSTSYRPPPLTTSFGSGRWAGMASGSCGVPSFGGEAMNRRAGIKRLRSVGRWAGRGVLGAVLLGLVGLLGCTSLQPRSAVGRRGRTLLRRYHRRQNHGRQRRARFRSAASAWSSAWRAPAAIARPTPIASMLENDLLKDRVPKVKEVMTSPNHAMVLVSGLIPPGASKGDRIDLEVTLPQRQPGHQLARRLPAQVHVVQLRFRRAAQPRSQWAARHVARPSHRRGRGHGCWSAWATATNRCASSAAASGAADAA